MNDLVDNKILKRYEIVKKIGKGAYGQVWKAINKKNRSVCALKKVFDAFRNTTDCQRTYRQIMYLKELDHPNIVKLLDYYKSSTEKDVYIEMEFIQSDLSTTIKNGYLKPIQKEYIFAQIVAAVEYLHSGELIHRDIKPSNILVGNSCEAKLCDFGLIRSVGETDINMTDNIATRWYKAPQLLLSSNNYGKEVDIWSLGCILGQMYLGKPIFPGTSTFNQLERIIQVTGKPIYDVSSFIQSETSQAVLSSFQYSIKNRPLREIYPSLDPLVCDLLQKIFQFDPKKRPTLQQILQHQYFDKYRNKIALKIMKKSIKIGYDEEKKLSISQYKKLLTNPNDSEENSRIQEQYPNESLKNKNYNSFVLKGEFSQLNTFKQLGLKNFDKKIPFQQKQIKEKNMTNSKPNMIVDKRKDRQNISPDSQYSANSNHNKSVKSNTSKISIYKKMVSPTSKSTKSAKIGTSTPDHGLNNRKNKNIVETNHKQKNIKKDKDCVSDLSYGNSNKKVETPNNSSIKSNLNVGKSFPTSKNLTPQSKPQSNISISHPFRSPNNQSPNLVIKKRISNSQKDNAVQAKVNTEDQAEGKVLTSPTVLAQNSSSSTGYKFLTKNTNQPFKPTVVKHSGTTIYKGTNFRQP